MGYIKGIDTSKWQAGKVDFSKAKASGYEFVFLRIGYNTSKDAYFESDYAKAKSAGMKVGVYFYTTKLTESDAVNEANRVLCWLNGKTLDMPIAYDMEESSMKSASRKDLNAKQYNAFANVIKSKDFVPILYTGEYMFNAYFNKDLLTDNIWIAKYGKNNGNNNGLPNVGRQVAIHQYTSAAIPTDFYTEKLDRNDMLISYDDLMKKTNNNSSTSNNTNTTYTHKQFIKDVQSAIGAKVDGIAGKETLSKTVTVSKTKNNRHAVVKPIQKYLNALEYDCGITDGIAGTKFDLAVKTYQKANGCIVDGELTKEGKTWKCILGIL